MAFQYLSPEWLAECRRLVDASPEFRAAAQGLNATLLNVITNAPGGQTIYLYYCFRDGKIEELTVGTDSAMGERPAEFRATGTYETYMLVNQGKLGSTAAIFTRKIRLEGNLVKALRNIRPLDVYNGIVRTIPTVY